MNASHRTLLTLMVAGGTVAAPSYGASAAGIGVQNRTIAYVMTDEFKAIYETKDGKKECPTGLNEGPREQFKDQFPEKAGVKYKLTEGQLARESDVWWPKEAPDQFGKYAIGNVAIGLNLDGKVGPNDFASPDGEKGIDNTLQRVWGCVENYRSTSYNMTAFNLWRKYPYNIIVIELTDVDSMVNDDDVTLTTYRGLDRIMTDASGQSYLPGATQRLDMRWGKSFIQKFHGKIANGVLRTEGADYLMPSAANGNSLVNLHYYNAQWSLNVMPDHAEGLMGGYMDVTEWGPVTGQQRSTHHQAYGTASVPSIYRAMMANADARPDPVTGKNTAISMALRVRFTQVFVKHPDTVVGQDLPASVGRETAR